MRCLCARAVDPDAPMTGARGVARAAEGPAGRLGRDRRRRRRTPRPRRDGAARRARTTAPRSRSPAPRSFAASVIRERLTQQTWPLIGRLKSGIARLARAAARPTPRSSIASTRQLTTIAALSGLFDENFNRGAGWLFYELGRRIERGINTCRLARQFAASGGDRAQSRRAARPHRFADHLSLALR